MKVTGRFIILISLLGSVFSACNEESSKNSFSIPINTTSIKKPEITYAPERYICYKTSEIIVDGLLNEESWINAEWSSDFVDIEGGQNPAPLYSTKVKMLWDNNYLYIAAELVEPHIWANLRQRDTVIFYDNDFEVFIDPDGDTHGYYEFEINALNTIWDLLLTRPYRDNGNVINAWDIKGIKSAVKIYGTINNASDIDNRWVVELAFPLDVLKEWGNIPANGTQWRINFSRVNWRTQIVNGKYIKERDPETGKTYPEYNWVWSPQGVINMHAPETWGYIQFSDILSGNGRSKFVENHDELIKWDLRKLYYAEREFASQNNSFTSELKELIPFGFKSSDKNLKILIKPAGYEAYIKSRESNLIWTIDNTGRVYSVK